MRTTAQLDQNYTSTLMAVSAADGETPVLLEADPLTGALLTSGSGGGTAGSSGLVTVPFDYIGVSYPDAVTETYVYRMGGSGGDIAATVTVSYTDSTKTAIASVAKT